jgi:hypothetical protein
VYSGALLNCSWNCEGEGNWTGGGCCKVGEDGERVGEESAARTPSTGFRSALAWLLESELVDEQNITSKQNGEDARNCV